MPLNDFFTTHIIHQDENSIRVQVQLDPKHRLFEGHFPGQPVTPGVALIEILRQILCTSLNKKLMLTSAKEIKYLSPVLPTETTTIEYRIDYTINEGTISVNCLISQGEKVFTKIKGDFCEE